MDIESYSPKKSYWREKATRKWMFYCPLCRTQRALPCRPNPGGAKHVAQVAITAAFFTCLTWNWFTWKGMVSFIPFWIIFETVYRGHVRAALSCSDCGFDPYLYQVDVPRARQEIETHWRKKFADKGIPYPGDEKSEPESPDLTESEPQG